MKKKTKKPVSTTHKLVIASKKVAALSIYNKTMNYIVKNNHMCTGQFKKIVDDYVNGLK